MTALDESDLAASPAPLHILLLEDSILDAELTCASLGYSESDCNVERVDDREAFEAALDRNCFDLILADYSLPSFDGIAALEIAQERCPDVPFIFVSGALGEELAIETLKTGATDYVLKHRLDRLRPSVERALRERDERLQRRAAEEKLRQLAAENARLYEDARRANETKDQFIAMVSHELRTPMTSILGWTRLLKMGDLTSDESRAAIDAVERSATVQARLIDDLLDVSRISTGKLQLEFDRIDLREIVQAAIESLRLTAEEKGLSVSVSTPDAVDVRGDRNRLQQVVSNLIQNAIKFTPTGGRIQIHVARMGSLAELRVSDTGIGVRSDFLERLFEPFQQAGNSGEGGTGLGLGLSIVRHIVERHGGSVVAESEGRGRGTTFRVTLPLLSASATVEPARDLTQDLPVLSQYRFLVVEDDPETRQLVTTILSRCGGEVTAAGSVAEAIEILRSRECDVIITDIAMPIADGYELIRLIHAASGPSPPVIALTAFGSSDDRHRTAAAGFAAHFVKPVDPVTFANGVAALLEQRKSRL